MEGGAFNCQESAEQLQLTQWEGSTVVCLQMRQLNAMGCHVKKLMLVFSVKPYVTQRIQYLSYHKHPMHCFFQIFLFANNFKTDELNRKCINSCNRAERENFVIKRCSTVSWSSHCPGTFSLDCLHFPSTYKGTLHTDAFQPLLGYLLTSENWEARLAP